MLLLQTPIQEHSLFRWQLQWENALKWLMTPLTLVSSNLNQICNQDSCKWKEMSVSQSVSESYDALSYWCINNNFCFQRSVLNCKFSVLASLSLMTCLRSINQKLFEEKHFNSNLCLKDSDSIMCKSNFCCQEFCCILFDLNSQLFIFFLKMKSQPAKNKFRVKLNHS